MPKLERQLLIFIGVGLAQLFLESLLYLAGTLLGVPPIAANVTARVLAAVGGYILHSRLTFAPGARGRNHQGGAFLRYAFVWVSLTALSTLAVASVANTVGLQGSWLAKPVIDGLLAVLSFVLLRGWVFRIRT